ncbi:MAG TPA: hypothetical protein VMK65_12685 [Longimicrobiales bacterium]|nr:hypothetical protein [Longimicrobiales bacterium]
MAGQAHNKVAPVRCLQCGKVDAPDRLRVGAGWPVGALWLGAAAAWLLGWYWPVFNILFWVVLLAAFVYTLWHFSRREQACRHCGGRTLEPHTAPPSG